ncbi:MAG: gamma-glutamylcyclotransferase family protein [Verrucomicrobiota bacterium]
MNVFTYGSLVFPEVWMAVTRLSCRKEEAKLHGYQNRRVKDATFPGILHTGRKEDVVEGLLYLDVSAEALERLDRFEDTFYDRQTVEVSGGDSTFAAEAYVVPAEQAHVLSNKIWDRGKFERDHLKDFLVRCCGY